MLIHHVEARVLDMPLRLPFRTSQSLEVSRRAILIRVDTDRGPGWADLAVEDHPIFGHEFIESTRLALRTVLVPALAGEVSGARVAAALGRVAGHRAAKSALEMAILDAQLRASGLSLSEYLGGTRDRVRVGVSIGITETVDELIGLVEGYLADGYSRIKLKVQPGWDEILIGRVRAAIGDDVELQVDGNGAYTSADVAHLARFERYGLTMLEQPFPTADLRSHIRLAAATSVPVCLDESIGSAAEALAAIESGACSVVNIKPARVGGYLEARRIHDVCAAASIPVWCGGMLESGVGRAQNLALASLPNFLLASDISATDRYFARDITERFDLVDGALPVPTGPGSGVTVDLEAVEDFTVARDDYEPAKEPSHV
ncbi:o-succinylbenzoate synthase [Millisia brevis]|uniref:o-succinylbenzoate synthase n=1 Tax=Millisia brevis TaxID=264148 RepID=UPI000836EA03|nr:o-succinylbenzoate synthase [Millisia brevis]